MIRGLDEAVLVRALSKHWGWLRDEGPVEVVRFVLMIQKRVK